MASNYYIVGSQFAYMNCLGVPLNFTDLYIVGVALSAGMGTWDVDGAMLVDNVLTQLALQIWEGNWTQAEKFWRRRVSHVAGMADGECMLCAFHPLLAYQKIFVLSLPLSSWR